MRAEIESLESKCKKSIEHFKRDIGRLRTGRASASLLDGLMVDYYGSATPLIQLGMIAVPEPRIITIQVYDPGAVDAVEKAIQQSELGLNPGRDGNLIRIVIPALTEERRKDLIKKLHKMGEETKVTIRNHRRESIDVVKQQEKDKSISEDAARKSQEEIQKVTDKFSKEVDTIIAAKEKEMMEV